MITENNARRIANSLSDTSSKGYGKIIEYAYLLKIFDEEILTGRTTCSECEEFRYLFYDFFAMDSRAYKPVVNAFFALFDDLVANVNNWEMDYVLNKLSSILGRVETSYASKMVHMFNHTFAIWDSVLTEHFRNEGYTDIKNSSYQLPLNERIESAFETYCYYASMFEGYVHDAIDILPGHINGSDVIRIFNSTIPTNPIPINGTNDVLNFDLSDVKKVDFILWLDRENLPKISFHTEAREIRKARFPDYNFGR